jgi:hypothetical protein
MLILVVRNEPETFTFVMAGLVPAIPAFVDVRAKRRGCPGQAGPDEF